jgi:hypothetical protein
MFMEEEKGNADMFTEEGKGFILSIKCLLIQCADIHESVQFSRLRAKHK